MEQPTAGPKLTVCRARSHLLNATRTPTKACKDTLKPGSAQLIPAELPLMLFKAHLNPWNSDSINQHPNPLLGWSYSVVKRPLCSAAVCFAGPAALGGHSLQEGCCSFRGCMERIRGAPCQLQAGEPIVTLLCARQRFGAYRVSSEEYVWSNALTLSSFAKCMTSSISLPEGVSETANATPTNTTSC